MPCSYWYDNPASPVGRLYLTSDGEALTGCWFDGHQRFMQYVLDDGSEVHDCRKVPVFQEASEWLDTYFQGKDPGPLPAYNLSKLTPFRQKVCAIMARIPYGQTITYGDIAHELERVEGRRMSSQAVGGAVGHNPVGVIIPCHRVVGAGGSLVGYGGGMDRKVALLTLEGVDMGRFKVPTKGTALAF